MKTTAIVCLVLAALLGFSAAQQSKAQFINDNHVLNYALSLEYLEAALYAAGLAQFADSDFNNAQYPAGTRSAIAYIGNVESQHASQISSLLGARGWPAVPVCTNYNFTSVLSNGVTGFIQALATVEQAGTAAYDGAAGAITDKNILTLAAGIATVEARHSALIVAVLNGQAAGSFAPTDSNARTQALTFNQIQTAIAPFLLGATCNSTQLNTTYNGQVTVSTTTPASYQWQYANTLRNNQPQSTDVANQLPFYNSLKNLPNGPAAALNDLAVLNYALTLENLEATFYNQTANAYNVANIKAAFAGGQTISDADAAVVSANIAVIAAHEAVHVGFLTSVISSLAAALQVTAAPATPCNYTLAFNSLLPNPNDFSAFTQVAATLENTGVSAYVGAISLLTNADAAQIAATIATVEGNHAAYIANLRQDIINQATFRKINPNITSDTNANVANGLFDAPVTPTNLLAQSNVQTLLQQCIPANFGNPSAKTVAQLNFFKDQDQTSNGPFTPQATQATTQATPSTTTPSGPTSTTVALTVSGNPGTDAVKAAVVAALNITDASLVTVSTTPPTSKRQSSTTYYVTIKSGAVAGQSSTTIAQNLAAKANAPGGFTSGAVTVTGATVINNAASTTVPGSAAVAVFSIGLIAMAALF